MPDSARHHSRVTLSLAAIYSDMWSTYETRVEFSAWRITTRAFGNTILFFSCHSGRSSLFFFLPTVFRSHRGPHSLRLFAAKTKDHIHSKFALGPSWSKSQGAPFLPPVPDLAPLFRYLGRRNLSVLHFHTRLKRPRPFIYCLMEALRLNLNALRGGKEIHQQQACTNS